MVKQNNPSMRTSVVAILGSLLGCFLTFSSAASQQTSATASTAAPYRALLDQYCVTCHNERTKTAGLMLDKLDIDHVAQSAETWEKDRPYCCWRKARIRTLAIEPDEQLFIPLLISTPCLHRIGHLRKKPITN